MARTMRYGVFLVLLCMMGSCTPEHVQLIKEQAMAQVPVILEAIAETRGKHYADVVRTFFQVAQGPMQELSQPREAISSQQYPQQQSPPQQYPSPKYPQHPPGGGQQPLEIQLDVVKQTYVEERWEAASVMDGDTLTGDDNYKILFRPDVACYMYVVQLDSTGKLDPIFPSLHVPWGNPVEPDATYSIPPDDDWFCLDQNTGVETIYFIASRQRIPDLEHVIRQVQEKNKTLSQTQSASLKNSYVVTRGVSGARPANKQSVRMRDGRQGHYTPTVINSLQAEFTVTRWFYHQ